MPQLQPVVETSFFAIFDKDKVGIENAKPESPASQKYVRGNNSRLPSGGFEMIPERQNPLTSILYLDHYLAKEKTCVP